VDGSIKQASLYDMVAFLDTHLQVAIIPDDPNALNGLQVEAGERVHKVACAVDADEWTIDEACRQKADLLLVHHGLFWGGNRPLVGAKARKLRRCFESGLSVYSAHLPLDAHPECGNNIELVRGLGLVPEATFGRFHGIDIGFTAKCDFSVEELENRLRKTVGRFQRQGRGRELIRRVGVVSGGAGSLVGSAASAGLDALITGEGAHYMALEAEEQGIHLFLAGHYRSEVFGVQALGRLLESKYGLPHFFLEHDTGL
jgi:dinuclear metal center YbgI/SA1388 family protein